MQAEPVGNLAQLVGGKPQLAAILAVCLVAEGNDGVDPVVAPVELEHDQNSCIALGP